MSEPLILRKVTEGNMLVSKLQFLDLTHIKSLVNNQDYEDNLVRLLNILADDLITINGGDYETQIRLFIDSDGIDVTFHRSYPFLFISGSGPVENLCFSFDFDDCSAPKFIHQRIDFLINSHLNDNNDGWLYAKIYSDIASQKFYQYLTSLDIILFKEPTLLSKFSYLDSIYEASDRKHIIGNVITNITPKPTPLITINFGWLYIAITNKGILIRSNRTKEEEINTRRVLNQKNIEHKDIEKLFIDIYNRVYETSYTEINDLILVHDMMEI